MALAELGRRVAVVQQDLGQRGGRVGQIELLPGAEVASSAMLPIPTEW
jgi:hypothetical protein